MGFGNLLRSRKAALALVGMFCVMVLGALERITGEAALAAIVLLSGAYGAAQAYEDRVLKRRPPVALGVLLSLLSGGIPLVTGCGAATPPGCTAEDNALRIAEIDREYLGALLDQCLAYESRAACPHAKRLEAERDAKVKAYEQECTR